MQRIGTVREIWRYPVKSMAGERLDDALLDPGGIPGDRAWAVRDEKRGGIRGAKKIPGLMRCAARYLEPPTRERVGAPEITLPDGARISASAADAAARVSAAVETPVSLWPLLPASELAHYRRGRPDHDDLLTELRAIFGRLPDEPLPDIAAFPPELLRYESPPGTYFDAFPVLLLTSASLARLARAAPGSRVDVRRFRPNFVIETAPELEGYPESSWVGRRLRLGGIELEGALACPRCVMVTHPFADLPRDTELLRSIVRDANQNVGLYARPLAAGCIAVGDEVLLD
ncbi:MAG TPA: MOSC N-terminal beta barrel domain-containing protein [Myxococcota bacterium]|nr:MOSC N-terminal beta barrel domain-containing protein [Myxococcota bacterium]